MFKCSLITRGLRLLEALLTDTNRSKKEKNI